MRTFDVLFAGFALLILAFVGEFADKIMLAYGLSVLFLLLKVGWNINIASMLVILAVFKGVEWVLVPVVLPLGNYWVYPIWAVVNFSIYLLLIYRAPILRKITNNSISDKVCITNADLVLGGLHLVHCAMAVLALVEHCLRHLDDFGVPASYSIVNTLRTHAFFVYPVYPYASVFMNILEVVTISATSLRFMRSARVLAA